MINVFATNQFLVIGIFLIVLVGLMILARKFRDPLAAQLGGQRRIKLIEDTSIGASDRIKLVTIDDVQYAIITSKNQQPVVVPLAETGMPANKPQSSPKSAPPKKPDTASQDDSATMAQPFLQAMKKARSRNPLLGFDK